MNANGLNKDEFGATKSDFKSEVLDLKHDAKDLPKDFKSDAKDAAKDFKSDAKDAAKDLKSDAKDLRSEIKAEVSIAAKKMKSAAEAVRDEVAHGVNVKKMLEAGKSLGDTIDTQITAKPYIALGVAAAAGFGIGCVLGSRFGRVAMGVGLTVAARRMLEEVDFKKLAHKAFGT